MELLEREIYFPGYVAFGFLLSLGVLLLSKILAPNFLSFFKNLLFSTQPLSSTAYSDSTKVRQGRSLLMINYFVVSSTAAEMIRLHFDMSFNMFKILSPILYFLFVLSALYLTKFISGESKGIQAQNIMLFGIFQITGILLLPILVMWYLNPGLSNILVNIILIVFTIFTLYRLIRGFFIGLSKQISWYYLILYLCTSEIYPLALAYAIFIGF